MDESDQNPLFMNWIGGAPRQKAANVNVNATTEAAAAAAAKPLEPLIPILDELSAPITNNVEIINKALFRKRKTLIELSIDQPMSGMVSLAALDRGGFKSVGILRFAPGAITELRDVPATVHRIIVAGNRLHQLDDLPEGIEHLDLRDNRIQGSVSLRRFPIIKYLNVERNQLSELTDLPGSLLHLHANHNLIREINLFTCPLLQTLELNANPDTIVYNLSDTVVHQQLPERVRMINVAIDSTTTNTPASLSVGQTGQTDQASVFPPIDPTAHRAHMELLEAYFVKRDQYANDRLRAKAAKPPTLPACLGCGRKVGMVFLTKPNKYVARCGSSSHPCTWSEEVARTETFPVRSVMQEMYGMLEQARNGIIRQKLDTLFEYISEEDSAALFKKQRAFYQSTSELLAKYKRVYETAHFNQAKAAVVTQKLKKMQDLIVQSDEEFRAGNLDEAVRIQTDEIEPISRYISSLKYEVRSLAPFASDPAKMALIQRSVLLSREYTT